MPRILITNDDGVNAPGLKAVAKRLLKEEGFDIRVVAPAVEQSAKSSALTIHGVLEVEKHSFEEEELREVLAYRVHGTPVDCVMMAHNVFCAEWEWRPDLVVSGMNRGNNAGLNVINSGTVGAALAARKKGLNSVALSLDHPETYVSGEPHGYDRWNYDVAMEAAMPVLIDILHHRPIEGLVLNVNVPNVPVGGIKGIRLTRQGYSSFLDTYKEVDPSDSRRRFSIHGYNKVVDSDGSYDTFAMSEGFVAVTPLGLHFDPSHAEDYSKTHGALIEWKSLSGELEEAVQAV